MPAWPRSPRLRTVASVLAMAALVEGCGSAGSPPKAVARTGHCAPEHLDACERALPFAAGTDPATRVQLDDYAAARAAKRGDADGWVALWHALGPKDAAKKLDDVPVVVLEGAVPDDAEARARAAGATVVRVGSLPKPEAIADVDLLVAIGRTAGRRLFVRVRSDGAQRRVDEVFAGDPLGPFVAGLHPVVRDDAALEHLGADAALAASIARALHEASQFHYVDAAEEAERLGALVKARAPLAEPTLRGRYALQLLDAAGLVLEPAPGTDPASADPPPFPAPTKADSPYGDLLRVRLSTKDPAASWAARRAQVLPGIAQDRRDALDALFAPETDCAASTKPPPMDGPRDLLFGSRLAYAAERGPSVLTNARRGLPLEDWLPRYAAFVDAVDATDTMWAFAPSVLYERGDALDTAGSTTYRRVTTLGLEHLRAVRKLEAAYPARFPALAHVPLDYAAGLLSDPKLRDELVGLNRATVDDRIGGAKDAGGVFEGAIAGVFAGMSYPPALRGPHFEALASAFSKKLHGDVTAQTGWKVAGLYAADALAHALRGDTPDVAFSRDQILRALGDAKEPMPGLAALARAATRYVALGLAHDLDPAQRNPARFSAERRAARDALAQAIAGLGETSGDASKPGDTAPPGLLADVTDLGDGVVAALAARISDKRPAPAKGTCAAPYTPSPAVARTLAKLGDVRLRILASPHFKRGDGAWVRRARLVVTALSDALDLLAKKKDRVAFTVSDADADTALAGALRDVADRDVADALASGYGLARAALSAKDARDFADRSGARVRGLLRGLAGLFGDEKGARSGADTLVSAFAGAKDAAAGAHDVTSALLAYARAFYGEDRGAQGDLLLLGTLAASALSHREPPPDAVALATAQKSRLAWALSFLAETAHASFGGEIAPERFADGMRRALVDRCASGSVDEVLGVLGAIRDRKDGKKLEARRALDALLDQADASGLAIPKITYRYEESTKTKVFTLSLDVSYGAGLLTGANGFQLGLGMRSTPRPIGQMTERFAPIDDRSAEEEAARWYVHVAALAAAWHFLDGDEEHAIAAARRVVSASIDGLRLGPRAVRVDEPGRFANDARELVAVDAELAAEAGHPFLAGDLWTVVKSTLADDTTPGDAAKMLADPPLGLAGETGDAVHGVLDRSRRALGTIAAHLPCVGGKVDTAPYDDGSCQAYTTGLALRIADALPALPHLRKGAELSAPRCAPLRAVDDFLTLGEQHNYDPDAFTRAVDALRGAGRLYDAAVLFTRQRLEKHCSPGIVATARELGRAPTLGPVLRANLLGVAVNCTVNAPDDKLGDDLVALDHETASFADPSHNLRLMLFTSELALGRDDWPLLARLVARPDFVSRWVSVSPTAATAALVVDHASHVVSGTPIELAKTEATYGLLCESLPSPDRTATCASLRAMREREKANAPKPDRQKAARAALGELVRGVSEPAKKPKP